MQTNFNVCLSALPNPNLLVSPHCTSAGSLRRQEKLLSPIMEKEARSWVSQETYEACPSPTSIFIHPWKKPYWTDHNHAHLFGLRNAGLQKLERRCTMLSITTTALGGHRSTLTHQRGNMHGAGDATAATFNTA